MTIATMHAYWFFCFTGWILLLVAARSAVAAGAGGAGGAAGAAGTAGTGAAPAAETRRKSLYAPSLFIAVYCCLQTADNKCNWHFIGALSAPSSRPIHLPVWIHFPFVPFVRWSVDHKRRLTLAPPAAPLVRAKLAAPECGANFHVGFQVRSVIWPSGGFIPTLTVQKRFFPIDSSFQNDGISDPSMRKLFTGSLILIFGPIWRFSGSRQFLIFLLFRLIFHWIKEDWCQVSSLADSTVAAFPSNDYKFRIHFVWEMDASVNTRKIKRQLWKIPAALKMSLELWKLHNNIFNIWAMLQKYFDSLAWF